MTGKRLSRQLRKTFASSDLIASITSWKKDVEALPDFTTKRELTSFFETFPSFLSLVDDTYIEGDQKTELAQRNLEISTFELAEANKDLHHLNTTFDAMLNSLGQGFFIFDRSGICLPIFSKACERLINCKPAGKNICEVLAVKCDDTDSFKDWYEMLFEDRIDFADLAALGPQYFEGDPHRIVSLEYRAVRGPENEITCITVIATDRTAEIQAQRKADELQAHVTFLASALKDRQQFKKYVSESRRLFAECVNLVHGEELTHEDVKVLDLNLHTLKGAAGTFGMVHIKDELHDIETRLKEYNKPEQIKSFLSETIEQVVQRFESLLEDNKEIVGDFNKKTTPTRELELKDLVDLANAMKAQSNMRSIYDDFIHKIVSVPAGKMFEPFDSTLQSIAKRLNKTIGSLAVDADSLVLIPENYNDLMSSMVHIFRNIAAHGIETPEERVANGKSPEGHVTVQLKKMPANPNRFSVVVSDDGRGVNYEKIRNKIHELGFHHEADSANHHDLIEWLFKPHFSTADRVTEFSGRGVGLAAVRRSAELIGGSVRMESTPGFGSIFYFDLPIIQEVPAEVSAEVSANLEAVINKDKAA